MKALEKDRNRRYETANGFAADVQRYLADEPVQACPPSALVPARQVRPAEPEPDRGGGLIGVLGLALAVAVGWQAVDGPRGGPRRRAR